MWVSSLLSMVWCNGHDQPSVFSLFPIAKSERVQNINVLCCGHCNLLWSALRETQHFAIFFSLQSGAMCICQLGLALQHKMGCEIDLCKLWSYPLPLQLASYFSIVTKTCIVISMKNMCWIPFKTHHHDHHLHLQSNKSLLFTSKRGLERTQNQTTPSSSDP